MNILKNILGKDVCSKNQERDLCQDCGSILTKKEGPYYCNRCNKLGREIYEHTRGKK